MDSFYRTSGSSPPKECHDNRAEPDPRSDEQTDVRPLPEELVEALAALLAQALINDIRQYPDLREATLSSASPPDPAEAALLASPRKRCPPCQSEPRHTSTRGRARRPAHAPSH